MRLPIVALATLALLLGAAAAQQAPLRYRAPGEGTAHSDDKATTCRRGYGYNEDDGTCFPCTNGFFSPGGRSRCLACAKRGRSHHFSTPQGAWRASQCVCRPGHGGVDCEPCERNTWSPGGVFGSDDRSQARPFCRPCPANSYGTRKQGADSLFDCGGCVAGYGGLSCEPCPPGTWSPGGSYSPCQKCGPYQSSPPASSSSTFCTCVAGYGTDAVGQCSICPVGTWWPGPPSEASAHAAASVSTVSACLPCSSLDPSGGGGFTTLTQGATSARQCVCKPGHAGQFCRACQAGDVCPGGSTEVLHVCPSNSYARNSSASNSTMTKAECVCKPGTGKPASNNENCADCPICEPCPAGTWAAGGTRDTCSTCPPGTTSPAGSTTKDACKPIVCPDGMQLSEDPNAANAPREITCVCKAGYGGGSDPKAGCQLCPYGTFALGGSLDSCTPCPFGFSSRAGANASGECQRLNVTCPRGQVAPANATSPAECACMPGHGTPGACSNCTSCSLCPVGTWSSGGRLEPCLPCDFNFTSLPGAITKLDCFSSDQCPPGTQLPAGTTGASAADCKCKAGFGSVLVLPPGVTTPFCTQCPAGTWAAGGTRDTCSTCPPGTTSPAGSTTKDACKPIVCPDGMQLSEDPNAANAPREITCVCKAGYGGGSDPKAGCQLCPYGTFALGGSLDSCTPCPFGFSSRAGANASSECRPLNVTCPRGQVAPANATSPAECACMPGHGTPGACSNCTSCSLCPVSTWSSGGRLEPCLPCDFNFTSLPGAITKLDCFSSDQCPPGTQLPAGTTGASAADCKCKAGFGSVLVLPPGVTTPFCTQCLAGLYSPGGTLDTCLQCPGNTTSIPGATNITDCTPLPSPAP